jgi:WD repeat-containing protein 35
MIGNEALQKLDLASAQKAFVRCQDYHAIQFVKRLQLIDVRFLCADNVQDKAKQKAEIQAYLEKFDDAEKLYTDMDRTDLAVDLRMRLGDWIRVAQVLKTSPSAATSDVVLENAWSRIGDSLFDRQQYQQAAAYYAQARNLERLADCYYFTEDFVGLEKILYQLPDDHALLPVHLACVHSRQVLAQRFKSVGMSQQAITAHLKRGNIKAAIDVCVYLNEWQKAIELAEIHKMPEIESLLEQYAKRLIEGGRQSEVVELYHKANYCDKSAPLLFQMASDFVKSHKHPPPMRAKKLYVLAALEVERRQQMAKASKVI